MHMRYYCSARRNNRDDGVQLRDDMGPQCHNSPVVATSSLRKTKCHENNRACPANFYLDQIRETHSRCASMLWSSAFLKACDLFSILVMNVP
jgi:hypothetical protein